MHPLPCLHLFQFAVFVCDFFLLSFTFDFHLGAVIYMKWCLINAINVYVSMNGMCRSYHAISSIRSFWVVVTVLIKSSWPLTWSLSGQRSSAKKDWHNLLQCWCYDWSGGGTKIYKNILDAGYRHDSLWSVKLEWVCQWGATLLQSMFFQVKKWCVTKSITRQ